MISRRGLLAAGAVAAAGAVSSSCSWTAEANGSGRRTGSLPEGWVATWGAPTGGPEPEVARGWPGKSIRNVLHTSIGGSAARIRLSNRYGDAPVRFDRVTLALAVRPDGPEAEPGTMREVTFDGRPQAVLQPGTERWSDEVNLELPADSDILVTTYSASESGTVSYHKMSVQVNFMAEGDAAADESPGRYDEQNTFWRYVTEIAVRAPNAAGTVIPFGGSTTDGAGSSMCGNNRWSNYLARRLLRLPPGERMGVYNAGVSANRMLMNSTRFGHDGAGRTAFKRLDSDVLRTTAARTMIMAHGINDLWQPPLVPHTTSRIVEEMQRIVHRCHARGVRVVGSTLTPFKGWVAHSQEVEKNRQVVNRFIQNSGVFDGVIDFAAAIADPDDPQRMRPEFDFGDHLHCNDAGYEAMAEAVDLSLL